MLKIFGTRLNITGLHERPYGKIFGVATLVQERSSQSFGNNHMSTAQLESNSWQKEFDDALNEVNAGASFD